MAKNSDVIARNELQAARKEKAKAILDDIAKPFNLWTHISDFVQPPSGGCVLKRCIVACIL